MIDLTPAFKEGMNNLQKWRNRYSTEEYPYKVALNLFYRKYTMKLMWDEIMAFANQSKKQSNFQQALMTLELYYSRTATTRVMPILEERLARYPNENIGGSSYDHYLNLINQVRNGNNKAREEIEFSYLYFLLADKCTLYWAAVCSTGKDKISAIAAVTGFIISDMELNDYGIVSQELGQLYVSKYLQVNYTPLP